MTKIVNNNKLQLMVTSYGLSRIAEANANPSVSLNLTKIKFGSGDNYEYYTPSPDQEDLRGPLGLELYVYEKELLEDGLTISFFTVLTEDIGGFDIREAGLYESTSEGDKLFAIATQQPFVKPSSDDNYFINLDYYILLKAENFADVYDQITLDVEHALVTERSLEDLLKAFLFAQGNLANQIGNNSRIIGYNRATQLYEKIRQNETDFSYITLYKNFASILDMVSSEENIFSYWAFNYSRRRAVLNSIIDISKNGFDLKTNKAVNTITQDYSGFMSTLVFDEPNYFELSSQIPLNLAEDSKDIPFTMVFAVAPAELSTPDNPESGTVEKPKTLLARYNEANNNVSFRVQETPEGSLEVYLYTNLNNYLKFSSAQGVIPKDSHSLIITYNPATSTTEASMTAFVNSTRYLLNLEKVGDYTSMNVASSTLYYYSCTPEYSTYMRTLSNAEVVPCDEYGNQVFDTLWEYKNEKVFYNDQEATYSQDSSKKVELYAWVDPEDPTKPLVYTTQKSEFTMLYNQFFEEINMSDEEGGFRISEYNDAPIIYYHYNNEDIQLELQNNGDTPFEYPLKYYSVLGTLQVIYANASSNPSLLFNADGTPYTGNSWEIKEGKVYLIDDGNDFEAKVDEMKSEEKYSPDLSSYIIDATGEKTNFINSKVGIISIIKEALSDANSRVIALTLCSTMGRNPYMGQF